MGSMRTKEEMAEAHIERSDQMAIKYAKEYGCYTHVEDIAIRMAYKAGYIQGAKDARQELPPAPGEGEKKAVLKAGSLESMVQNWVEKNKSRRGE